MTYSFPVARMRRLDGATELAAATAAAESPTRPEAVTGLLAALLETVDGVPATRDRVRALPGGTREWLLQWAAARLNPNMRWFEARCGQCGAPFDLSLDLSQPVCSAPRAHADVVTVETSLGTRQFAIPTGAHEEELASKPASTDPRRDFAAICGCADTAVQEAAEFDEHDLALIDEALEAASPDTADMASAVCPNCGQETECRIDPLLFAFPRESDLLGEVHLIASAYGWEKDAILALAARHRTAFGAMIARDRRTVRHKEWRR
jgi:hypothetical protein